MQPDRNTASADVTSSEATSHVSRRMMAVGLVAAAAATAGAGAVLAEGDHDGHKMHEGMNHGAMDHGKMGHAMGAKHKGIIEAASDCIAKGEVCVAHCLDLIKGGEPEMVDCMKSVQIMMPMCAALLRLAALDAKRLKHLASVCRDVCADCEAECKKHAEKHAVCKACMESCTTCVKECKALLDG